MVAYAKTSLRAEKRALREKMRAMGLGYPEIAAELARRYRLRPRAAWREAYGWSLKEAAARINAYSGEVGLDPGGIAAMTAAHLCEHENWPGFSPEPSGRRPTPYLLALLAAVYGCAVTDLTDLADREHLPPADLLILDKYGHTQDGASMRAAAGTASRPANSPPAARAAGEAPGAIAGVPAIPSLDTTQYRDGTVSLASLHFAYRWSQEPVSGSSWIGREVEMAAHDGSEHAERAEQRDIGDSTLEQLRSDVVRLSRSSVSN